MQTLDKSLFTYTALFCEENIWKLIESLKPENKTIPVDVLFIINNSATIALFNQNISTKNQPVIWDYHVILSAYIGNKLCIFDFDSHSNFPVGISEYFTNTFPLWHNLHQQYQPLIKQIDANYYLRHFSSDRSHMLNIIPESEFPKYNIIQPDSNQRELTLDECRSIETVTEYSAVLTPEDYLKKMLGHSHLG